MIMKIGIFLGLTASLVLTSSALAQTFVNPLNTVELDQQVSPAASSSFLFNSPNKALASLTVVAGASAGFVMLIDATTLPANGALTSCATAGTTRPCLMWCVPVAANGYIDRQWNSPMAFVSGVLVAFSTTGCASLTASATAQMFGQAP